VTESACKMRGKTLGCCHWCECEWWSFRWHSIA